MALIDTSETYQMTNPGDHIDGTDVYQSNRNLLDNPWWGSAEVVNQRGLTTLALTGNSQPFIDRWTAIEYNGDCTLTLGANGITFTPAASGAFGYLRQKLANGSALNGKVLTASVMFADGAIYKGTITRSAGTDQVFYNANNVYLMLNGSDLMYIRIATDTKTVRAIKLELGSVSTLANDTPPNYVEELHKCEAYYKHLGDIRWTGYGMALNNSQIRLCISFPKMAKTPTSGIITTPKFYYNNAWTAASSYAVTDYDTSYVMFVINVSQTLTTGSSYLLQADNIQISADL